MYKNIVKRLIDIFGAIILIPLLTATVVLIGPLITAEDKGSIFFISKRLGQNGKIFKMYKFRTMRINATDIRNIDGSTYNSKDDERITKIGKFLRNMSIDELPQVINVLIGDMSLIGPRPDLPDAIYRYSPDEKKKLLVRPGITGYSQAYYRNSISAKEKYYYDLYYVDNLSFKLDTIIVLKTLKTVVLAKNINQN